MNQISLKILGIENIEDNDAENYSGGGSQYSGYDLSSVGDTSLDAPRDINLTIVAPEDGTLNFGDVDLNAGRDININIVETN